MLSKTEAAVLLWGESSVEVSALRERRETLERARKALEQARAQAVQPVDPARLTRLAEVNRRGRELRRRLRAG
jgi:hypothetical protein